MTTPDHDIHESDPLVRALRAGADPGLSEGAARRIADGAWKRASERRAGSVGFRARFFSSRARRAAVAAAVLVVAGAGALGLSFVGGAAPALAVEGDPVLVSDGAEGSEWTEAHRIFAGAYVFVPPGDRTLRRSDGSRLVPDPGSFLRVERAGDELRLRVEMLRGRAEVLGKSLQLALGEMDVSPAPDDAEFRASVEIETDVTATATPPPRRTWTLALGSPRVHVDFGRAQVTQRGTDESLWLGAAEAATVASVSAALPHTKQLMRLETWSPAVTQQIESGSFVIDAQTRPTGSMFVILRGNEQRPTAVDIPAVVRESAVRQLNDSTQALFSKLSSLRAETAELEARRLEIEDVLRTVQPKVVRELRFTKDGEELSVRLHADGSALLRRGDEEQRFPSIDALRKADPESARLFGAALR